MLIFETSKYFLLKNVFLMFKKHVVSFSFANIMLIFETNKFICLKFVKHVIIFVF